MTEVQTMIVASVITGLVSSLGTVAALKVHISYLKESIAELKNTTLRAHQRIDEHEKLLRNS